MGATYGNVTVLCSSLKAVSAECPRPALVGEVNGDVVVFASIDDDLAPLVSASYYGACCVAVSVMDDDLLSMVVYRDGQVVAAVLTGVMSEEFDDLGGGLADEWPFAIRSSATELVAAVGRGDVDNVDAVLNADIVGESDRHRALVEALGLPRCTAAWGYRYILWDRQRHANSQPSFDGPALTHLDRL